MLMKAMLLHRTGLLKENPFPLVMVDMSAPIPANGEILIKVNACGVCHTELDEIEGRTPPSFFPVVLGHQVVGIIVENGPNAHRFKEGDRVGVAWINHTCGKCKFCKEGMENLCINFKATGRDANDGYAEYIAVHEDFVHYIPEIFSDAQAAPLLCAGAIGYRSLVLTKMQNGQSLGLTGFGASAHLVMQIAKYQFPDSEVFVFARSEKERDFAMRLGARWAGNIAELAPVKPDCIIDTTPAWKPIVEALKNLAPGGRLIINAIRKEETDKNELLSLNYSEQLWMEKEIKSVANIQRRDIEEFLDLAAKVPIIPEVEIYPLEKANEALLDLKRGNVRGAKVLLVKK